MVEFRGQVKGRSREDEAFEIPTLYRAFLLVDAIGRLRHLMDWDELIDEYSPKYQKYNKVVNELVVQQFSELISVRPTREQLSLHVLRTIFARIATYWYGPPEVADITYMAQIQGHRHILDPDVVPGETPQDIKDKQLNYAANANYFDYKIGRKLADGSFQPVGDQGVKLGQPGVTCLRAFPAPVPTEGPEETTSTRKGKGKAKKESSSEWAPVTVRRHSREWYRELSQGVKASGSRQSEIDDAFLRTLLTQHVVSKQADAAVSTSSTLSLDFVEMPEPTRGLFRQAMAMSGATDLFSFLLAAAEPEAQRLLHQEQRHTAPSYETVATKALGILVIQEPGRNCIVVRFLVLWHTIKSTNSLSAGISVIVRFRARRRAQRLY